MGSFERFLAHVGIAWCCSSASARAEDVAPQAGPSRTECLAFHEHAQDARLSGQLLSARASLRECSATACPALVSRDCVTWLSEVEQQIPSVIFRAARDGEDLVALSVREDDRLLTESITGNPLELDPGPHHFVAELPGFPAQGATYVLQAGDKARVVRFDFVSPKADLVAPPVHRPGPPPTPAPPQSRPIPKTTYALGGVALAATGAGVVLGGLALAKRSDVSHRCAPLCDDADVRGVKNLAMASDIAFGLALLSAGVTVYTYATRPSVSVARAEREGSLAAPSWRLSWNGLGLSARGSF